jgi:hypothetical protein
MVIRTSNAQFAGGALDPDQSSRADVADMNIPAMLGNTHILYF